MPAETSPWMERALEVASGALGRTHPNPAVGAVVVQGGRIIGEGRTQPVGGAHAEIVALQAAGAAARGADLYVTLEPCAHHGRTPPCTTAIVAAGVRRVVYALDDPNPLVNGAGRAALQAAGIRVESGDGAVRARRILGGYLKWVTTGLPFINAKYALSLDGKLAPRRGDARWITSKVSRERVHQFRDRADAVMVGSGTILADDPALTARPGGEPSADRQPLRVIVDGRGRTPLRAAALDQPGRTLIATVSMPAEIEAGLVTRGAEVVRFASRTGHVPLAALCKALGERGITSVLVEGGGQLLGALLDERLIDRVYAFVAPIIIGGARAVTWGGRGAASMTDAIRLDDVSIEHLGDDVLVSGYLHYPGAPARGRTIADMFTGIVEEVGELQLAGPLQLGINAIAVLDDLKPGDSIAVNGVCLTVTAIDGAGFMIDAVPETRRLTNLGDLSVGAPVNLERAVAAGGRLGGHIVQGHVEGTATVERITPDGEATLWRFDAPGALWLRYVVPKGFIAIDGISLTVIDVDATGFAVTIIPFTREHTNLRAKRPGDRVNIETDILGRYVERLLAHRTT